MKFADELGDQNEHKFAKIIMISGMSMIDDRLKGYDAGLMIISQSLMSKTNLLQNSRYIQSSTEWKRLIL